MTKKKICPNCGSSQMCLVIKGEGYFPYISDLSVDDDGTVTGVDLRNPIDFHASPGASWEAACKTCGHQWTVPHV